MWHLLENFVHIAVHQQVLRLDRLLTYGTGPRRSLFVDRKEAVRIKALYVQAVDRSAGRRNAHVAKGTLETHGGCSLFDVVVFRFPTHLQKHLFLAPQLPGSQVLDKSLDCGDLANGSDENVTFRGVGVG